MNKYFILTYGCSANVRDSETIAGIFEANGWAKADDFDEADVAVFNTCTIRNTADEKVFGRLGSLGGLNNGKYQRIVVAGCMAEAYKEKFLKDYPYVDLVIGTDSLGALDAYLKQFGGTVQWNRLSVTNNSGEWAIDESLPASRTSAFQANITIMHGCDNFCSYCIVPFVRGRERSRQPEDILSEARTLVENGYKEITLIGQNVNSYGKGLNENISFPALLEKVADTGIARLRFLTSHPKDFSDELIEVIKRKPNICKQIHLPVQAGSDRILKAMNRMYTRDYFIQLVKRIKNAIPDVTLSTDIIVGFPGETEEEFLDTIDLVKQCEFDFAYTFMYSPRKDTVAASMEEQIPENVKKDRLGRLMEVQAQYGLKSNQDMLGKKYSVLVEGSSRRNIERLTGRTEGNKIINFTAQEDLTGQIVDVIVTEAGNWSLRGDMV